MDGYRLPRNGQSSLRNRCTAGDNSHSPILIGADRGSDLRRRGGRPAGKALAGQPLPKGEWLKGTSPRLRACAFVQYVPSDKTVDVVDEFMILLLKLAVAVAFGLVVLALL